MIADQKLSKSVKQYCCKQLCKNITEFKTGGVACLNCNMITYCTCGCKTYNNTPRWWTWKNRPTWKVWPTKKQQTLDLDFGFGPRSSDYCCSKKCFEIPKDQVDGRACNKCQAFSYCICDCIAYKRLAGN